MVDNKKRILECALELFWAKGYDAVGVQEIVNAAGVTKPTLYHYFGKKEGLLQELLKQEHTKLLEVVIRGAEYRGDLPLTLHKLTTTYFTFARNHPKFYRFIMSVFFYPHESEPYKVVRPLLESQHYIIEKMFLEASKDHGNMRGRHSVYAVTFLGMLNTYIELYMGSKMELDEQTAFRAVHQFMHGIYS